MPPSTVPVRVPPRDREISATFGKGVKHACRRFVSTRGSLRKSWKLIRSSCCPIARRCRSTSTSAPRRQPCRVHRPGLARLTSSSFTSNVGDGGHQKLRLPKLASIKGGGPLSAVPLRFLVLGRL